MNKKHLLLLIFINLSIALSFYIKNIGVGYSQLSSDLHNIIPMCMKFDNLELYKNDLFLDNPDNFKYYTPFFVQTIRFFGKLSNGNYVKGLNTLMFLTHLLFGFAWFLLFYRVFKNQFWLSLFISILCRGIVWLPGYELWGISDLWTLMPRTFYASLLPIPFIVLFGKYKYKIVLSGFIIGIIFNFHPISGLGGILLFVSLLLCLKLFYKNKINTASLLYGFLLLVIGMLPFLFTYFSKTETIANYDLVLYQTAFNSRIPSYFQEPLTFMNKWITIKTLFFIVPLFGFLILSFVFNKKHFKKSIILIIITVLLLIIPAISISIEKWLNYSFNTNLRMSFQLIRIQKFAILPSYFAMGFLFLELLKKYKPLNKILPAVVIFYFVIIIFSGLPVFDKIPFVSDDITRGIFPNIHSLFEPLKYRKDNFDRISEYISNNTPADAVFYKDYRLRAASKRSVKFDDKGASILIEGNPKALISWYQATDKLKKMNNSEKVDFLQSNGVNYILSNKVKFDSIFLVTNMGDYFLYKIK